MEKKNTYSGLVDFCGSSHRLFRRRMLRQLRELLEMLLLLLLLPLLLLLLPLFAQLLVLGGELPEPARQVLEGGVGPSRLAVQLLVLASRGHNQVGFLPFWLLPVRVLLVVLVTKKKCFPH